VSVQYFPAPPVGKQEPLQYSYAELQDLTRALNEPQAFLQLQVLNVAPTKPRDGMVVVADGTNWNPGSGAGVYARIGGSWVKL
jgi:hypothetical protein